MCLLLMTNKDPFTSDYLRAVASSWLRYEKGCLMISFERGLDLRNPDILGVTKDLKTIEIEIKVSFGDFQNDWKKRPRRYTPNQMYYMVHPKILQKVKDSNLLTTQGLLSINPKSDIIHHWTNLHILYLHRAAKVIHREKLRLPQLATLVKAQSGTLVKMAINNVHLANRTAPSSNMLMGPSVL